MGIKKFLISRIFFKHLALSLIGGVLLFWLSLQLLALYTSHGEAIEVPGLIGIQVNDLDQFDPEGHFRFLIIDSIFDDNLQKGAIVLQDPPPGSKVKSGRKIYLTVVTSQPETVRMPDLVDLSLRQALAGLKAAGLKVAKLEYISNMAKNAVLAQNFEGKAISAGTDVLKGSAIELVLGKGLKEEKIPIPFLIGKTEAEAINILNQSSFNVGSLNYTDLRDPQHLRVYSQQPDGGADQMAEYGQYFDLWFKSDLTFNFDSLINSYTADSTRISDEFFDSQTETE
ncbi:MAG: PASTA domain-containing protein [Bacteroidales bacterium]|nr:PASTA domain-containing protein [Bacteroidales bacterium]